MASAKIEKLEAEIEVKCNADMFYRMFKHDVKEIPKILPHLCQSVDVLEGDGIGVGSGRINSVNAHTEGKSLYVKEKMKVVDDEKRMITHSGLEGQVMNDYKFFDVTFIVTPKGGHGDGSVVKWLVEYERANENSPVPTAYIDFVVCLTKDLNAYLHKPAAKIEKLEVEIEVQCNADKFYRMFKHDVKEIPKHLPHLYQSVDVLEGDGIGVGSVKLWTYKLEEGEVMKDYKYFAVTFVTTPKGGDGDGDGSLVKWHVEYVKANKDSPAPTAYIDFAIRGTKDLNDHLHNQAA